MFTYSVWINVSLVRSNEMIRLYVKDHEVLNRVIPTGNWSANSRKYLGRFVGTDTQGYAMNGVLRDVSVYNRALNPDEIKTLSQIT